MRGSRHSQPLFFLLLPPPPACFNPPLTCALHRTGIGKLPWTLNQRTKNSRKKTYLFLVQLLGEIESRGRVSGRYLASSVMQLFQLDLDSMALGLKCLL